MSHQKYAFIDRIDPTKVGVIQTEGLKYMPRRNRANNTAALKNRLKHNGTSQLGHNKGVNPTGIDHIKSRRLLILFWSKLFRKND